MRESRRALGQSESDPLEVREIIVAFVLDIRNLEIIESANSKFVEVVVQGGDPF